MINKIATLTILFFTVFLLVATPLMAATATPSATPTSEVTQEEIEKSLQDRIKKAVSDNPATPSSVNQTSGLKAFIGTIESISGKTITIKTSNGIKQTNVGADTSIINKGKSGAKIEDLSVNDSIIAVGNTTDFQTQAAIRIVIFAAEDPDTRIVTSVTLSQVKAKSLTVNSTDLEEDTVLTISSKAKIYSKNFKALTIDDLEEDQKALAVVYEDDDDYILTRLILLNDSPQAAACGDSTCTTPENPETCPADCQS